MAEIFDLLELMDHVWGRHRDRMAGLGDDEWRWQPTSDEQLGLRWRLDHITQTLSEPRNPLWLGARPVGDAAARGPAASAGGALEDGEAAYARWRGWVTALDDVDLATPVGPAAGAFAQASRRSFVLHIVDELIHHTAEAALLRDLYARR